jgi:CRISPR/Cas system-associated exonuclease Cas4 (RecB family)
MENKTEERTVKLYNGKVELKFMTDGADKHEYYDERGKRLYGTTYYTGIIDKSAALMGWVAKLMGQYLCDRMAEGAKITEGIINLAKREYRKAQREEADRGKEIHKWISEWIAGNKPEMPEDEKVVNGITAFLKFQSENKVKWIESERLVYSKKLKVPGTLDAIGMIGKDLVLFDFKSSKPSSVSPDGIYPEHAIQTGGYQLQYEEETGKKIDYRIIIALNKATGEFRFREFKDNEADKKAFISCVNLKRRLNELK